MNLRILWIFTNVVFTSHPNILPESQGGDSIVGHRRSMRKSEESARRSHKYTNDVMMRSAVPSKKYVRFLNSTIEIDNKSGIRELEIFFEVTHADGSQMTHSYSGTIQPEKDYSVEVKEQIRRFINKDSYNYISSDDTLVQGVLNILMEFDDAPHYCHNKTIVVFKPTRKQQFDDQISEAEAELSRIEDDYYNIYEENKRAFIRYRNARRGINSFSINSNRMFGSISKNMSPINLNESTLPSKISLKHPNRSALNQEEQRKSKDQLCDDELRKPEYQEKCNRVRRLYGRARCTMKCIFEEDQITKELKLIDVEFDHEP